MTAKFCYFVCALLFLHCTNCVPVAPNNVAVQNFMRVVLEDFRKSIIDTGLDPIRYDEPHVVEINTPVAYINGELKEIIATGISDFIIVSTHFDLSALSMTWMLSDFGFYLSGDYNLTGVILSTYPISGNGQWQAHIGLELGGGASFQIADGFVMFDPITKYEFVWTTVISFPGFVEDDEFGGLGKDALLQLNNNIIANLLPSSTESIFNSTKDAFLTRFSEMRLIDIIGNYTNPPSTTTTTPRPSTTDPCLPCPLLAAQIQESNEVQILSEVTEEDEQEIIITTIYKKVSEIPKK